MREYGSDFHICDLNFRDSSSYFDKFGEVRFYACGRHAIDAILVQEKYKRIWIPAYFCYEVIRHITSTGIIVMFYDDNPLREDDDIIVRSLPYEVGDVLLKINFFGLRKWRSSKDIAVPVIEDHTHGLLSEWALKSDADWCIASIRKSLPVAAGGILWSITGKKLPDQLITSEACEKMASIRYSAMNLKKVYLKGYGNKKVFREKYIKSEEMIGLLKLSGMDRESYEIACSMNIKSWTDFRGKNWNIAYNLLKENFVILKPLIDSYWQPFSLVILCNSADERYALQRYMIKNGIYPAILWPIPEKTIFFDALDFSRRMLSVHCDIRYCRKAIEKMCGIINGYYDSNY